MRKHAEALRIQRYVQMHSASNELDEVLRATRGGPEGYDGVAELWWKNREDMLAATQSPEGVAAGRELLEDERRFIDLSRSPLWLGEEKPVIEPAH